MLSHTQPTLFLHPFCFVSFGSTAFCDVEENVSTNIFMTIQYCKHFLGERRQVLGPIQEAVRLSRRLLPAVLRAQPLSADLPEQVWQEPDAARAAAVGEERRQ